MIPNYQKRNTVQFSFATKLIHTVDNTKPIFDSEVGRIIGQKVKGNSKEEKIQSCLEIYEVMKMVFDSCLRNSEIQNILEEFKEKFNLQKKQEISDEKCFDFLLWGLGKVKQEKDIVGV